MTRKQAIYLCYMMADALSTTACSPHLVRAFGTHGREEAIAAIHALAEEHGFALPDIPSLGNLRPNMPLYPDERATLRGASS